MQIKDRDAFRRSLLRTSWCTQRFQKSAVAFKSVGCRSNSGNNLWPRYAIGKRTLEVFVWTAWAYRECRYTHRNAEWFAVHDSQL